MWRYGNSTDPIHRDKSDVWILGTVLGYVLTKRWDFEVRRLWRDHQLCNFQTCTLTSPVQCLGPDRG